MADRHLRLVQANQQQGRQNEMFNEMLRGYATMLLAAGRDRARWASSCRRSAGSSKVQYGTGLRPFELVQLQTCDLLPHPVAPQFGRYAVVRVRWGKRSKGGT